MSTYLVTGGAGYIGSYVVQHVRSEGHTARVLDNLTNGFRERLHPDVEFIEGDIRDKEAVRRAVEGVEGIFHLAALPRVAYSIEHPVEVHEVNTMGTLNILEAARVQGVKRVVFSSTSAIYGNAETFPTVETLPAQPLSPYALSKYLSEFCLKQYSDLYQLETVALRYFNAYGPHMKEGGAYATVVSAFLACRRAHRPFVIHGTGEQSRDFVHVTDIARANWLAMHSAHVGKGEIINIGSGTSATILQVAEWMKSDQGIIHEANRPGDPLHTLAGIEKAKRLLDWEPQIALEGGIKQVLEAEKEETSQ